MSTIIALSGFAGVGKDSVANVLTTHHGFARVAFADQLKASLYHLNPSVSIDVEAMKVLNIRTSSMRLERLVDAFGWDKAKSVYEVRVLLQRQGEGIRLHVDENAWVAAAFRVVEERNLNRVAISDCRYRNEAEFVRESGGLIVRIEKPGIGPLNDHASENEMTDFPFDATIYNDYTLDALADDVERVMERLDIL